MNAPLANPIPLRLRQESVDLLQEIEAYSGTQKSTLLRLAVKLGLPEVRKMFGAPEQENLGASIESFCADITVPKKRKPSRK